jgi:hypothetical protein
LTLLLHGIYENILFANIANQFTINCINRQSPLTICINQLQKSDAAAQHRNICEISSRPKSTAICPFHRPAWLQQL